MMAMIRRLAVWLVAASMTLIVSAVTMNTITSTTVCPSMCSNLSAACGAPSSLPSLDDNIRWLLSQSRTVREYAFSGNATEWPPNCDLDAWVHIVDGVRTESVALTARAFTSSGDAWTAKSLLRSVIPSPSNPTYGTMNGTELCALQAAGYVYHSVAIPLACGACYHFDWVSAQTTVDVQPSASSLVQATFAQGTPQLGITVTVGLAALALDAVKAQTTGVSMSGGMLNLLMPAVQMMRFSDMVAESPQRRPLTRRRGRTVRATDAAVRTQSQETLAPDGVATFHPAPQVHTMTESRTLVPETEPPTTATTDEPSTASTHTTVTASPLPTNSTVTASPLPTNSTVTASPLPTNSTVTASPMSTTSTASPTSTTARSTTTTSTPITNTTTTAPATTGTPSPTPTPSATTSAPSTTPAPAPAPYHARFDTQLKLNAWSRGLLALNVALPGLLPPETVQSASTVYNFTTSGMEKWLCSAPTMVSSNGQGIAPHPFIPLSMDLEALAYNTTNDAWTQCRGLAASVVKLDDWCGQGGIAFLVLTTLVRTFGVGYPVQLLGISNQAGGTEVDVELTAMCLIAAQTLQAAYLPAYLEPLAAIVSGLSSNSSDMAAQDCEASGESEAAAFSVTSPPTACGGPMLSLGLTSLRWMALNLVNPFDITTLLPAPTTAPASNLPGRPSQGSGPSATLNIAIGGTVGAVVLIVGGAIILRRVRRNPHHEALLQAPSDNLGFY